MPVLTWSRKKNVHQASLRCTYLRWCWHVISQSTSPHQGNVQTSGTSVVLTPQHFGAHQWRALLIIFTTHACMLVETAWRGLSVPVNIVQGLWCKPHSGRHSLAFRCPVEVSEYSKWPQCILKIRVASSAPSRPIRERVELVNMTLARIVNTSIYNQAIHKNIW